MLDEPLRLNKQERFAELVAQGQHYAEAYRNAGYKHNRGNAAFLANKEHIKARVMRIKAKLAEQHEQAAKQAAQAQRITTETLIAEVEEARVAALMAGQYSAAVAASKEKGVLAGLRVERSERGAPHEFADVSTAELLRELRELGYNVSEGSDQAQ